MSKVIVFASFYPKITKNKEVKDIILSMVKPTREEEGNEIYNFYEEKKTMVKIFLFIFLKSIKILQL